MTAHFCNQHRLLHQFDIDQVVHPLSIFKTLLRNGRLHLRRPLPCCTTTNLGFNRHLRNMGNDFQWSRGILLHTYREELGLANSWPLHWLGIENTFSLLRHVLGSFNQQLSARLPSPAPPVTIPEYIETWWQE